MSIISIDDSEALIEYMESEAGRAVCILLDDSKSTQNAIEFAIEKILNINDKVILLHCRESKFDVSSKLNDDVRNESHKILKRESRKLMYKHFNVKAIALNGDVRKELEKELCELTPDFIVMGCNRVGKVGKHIMQHIKVPLLIVRSPTQ